MTAPLTGERLAEIRAREQAATKGPWRSTYEESDQWFSVTGTGGPLGNGGWTVCPEVATVESGGGADAEFIAHARADVPDLLAALDAAEAEVQRKQAVMENVWSDYQSTQEEGGLLAAEVERLTERAERAEAALARVEALAEKWRYKGEFGWGPWQEGYGPDPEGHVLDCVASELREAMEGTP